MNLLANTPFAAERHVPASTFSNFDGTFDELLEIAELAWESRTPSEFNPAVMVVEVEVPGRFRNAVRELREGETAEAKLMRRRDDEEPVIELTVKGDKGIADFADLIFYPASELGEKDRVLGDAEWYLVSVNVKYASGPSEMPPTTMARNQLGRDGGSVPDTETGEYTSAQWAESVWNHRLLVHVDPS